MKESSQKFLYFNRDSRAGVLYFWLFFFKSTLMPVIMIGQYKPSENEADRMCVQGSFFGIVSAQTSVCNWISKHVPIMRQSINVSPLRSRIRIQCLVQDHFQDTNIKIIGTLQN